MKMSKLHASGTTWRRRTDGAMSDGHHPAWKGHAKKEMLKRRAANKVAKKSRQVNYTNVR